MKKLIMFAMAAIVYLGSTTAQDTTGIRKHQLGLDILPTTIIIMSGTPYKKGTSLVYKYAKEETWNWRIGMSYSHQGSDWGIGKMEFAEVINDSTLLTGNRNDHYYQIRNFIGFEKKIIRKRVTWYYGADAIFATNITKLYTTLYEYDLTTNRHEFILNHIDESDYGRAMSHDLGLDIIGGLMLPLSNHFTLTFETGLEFAVTCGQKIYRDEKLNNAIVVTEMADCVFNFSQSPLIRNVGIHYRF